MEPVKGQSGSGAGLRRSAAGLGAPVRAVRARVRALQVGGRSAALTGVLLGAILAAGLIDYALRMPAWLRGVQLALIAGATFEMARRWIGPAWRLRPGVADIALFLEESSRAGRGLRGRLASAIELADDQPADPVSKWMQSRAVAEAAGGLAGLRVGRVLDLRLTARRVGVLGLGIALIAGTWALHPGLARIGMARVVAPWAGAEWPKRTEVWDVTGLRVHASGLAVPLRAAAVAARGDARHARVAVRYRVVGEGRADEPRRALLTPQESTTRVEAGGGAAREARVFERLVEPWLAGRDARGAVFLEYWFETEDDRTEPARIRIEDPPRVLAARMDVQPPEYARGALPAAGPVRTGTIDAGPGIDSRALVGPVLAGSEVTLTIDFSKPVASPGRTTADRLVWATGGASLPEGIEAEFEPARWGLRWTAMSPARLSLRVQDEYGLEDLDDPAYAVETVDDAPPSAAITVPARDEGVLATAVVRVEGEGRDDIGVAWVSLDRQVARPPAGSIGAAAEDAGEMVTLRRLEAGAGERAATLHAELALEALGLGAGDEVWLTTAAQDTFVLGGARHEPVRSRPRRLRILDRGEFVDQVLAELSGVRRAAIALDQDQAAIVEAGQSGQEVEDLEARQRGLTERIGPVGQAVQELLRRLERNRLEDPSLRGLVEGASARLARAGEASGSAADALHRAGEPALSPAERARAQSEAGEGQELVRAELEELVRLLDRGEDSWLARRGIEELLRAQRDLQSRTAWAGAETVGLVPEALTAAQREALRRLAESQQSLAERARGALDELGARAEALRGSDPVEALGLEEAERRGRQDRVAQRMEEAAEQTAGNRTGEAGASQQAAIAGLEGMLEELDAARASRDAVLRRLLLSIVDSLDVLIAQQRGEMGELDRRGEGSLAGLDAGMVRLHQNTLALTHEIDAGFAELLRVRELVSLAAEAQAAAVMGIRGEAPDAGSVRGHEEQSLRRLEQARAEAVRLEREAARRELERRRREVVRAYRESLREHMEVRAETAALAVKEAMDRRDRQVSRRLGMREEGVRAALEGLRQSNPDIADAGMFDFAHQRLDRLLGEARDRLDAGEPGGVTLSRQETAARVLRSLIEALEDRPNRAEEGFRDAAGSGEGGAGGSDEAEESLLPELAQLLVLRAMQAEAADATRELGDLGAAAPAADMAAVAELQARLAAAAAELIEAMTRDARPRVPVEQEGPR